jgi:hypothetical protein
LDELVGFGKKWVQHIGPYLNKWQDIYKELLNFLFGQSKGQESLAKSGFSLFFIY